MKKSQVLAGALSITLLTNTILPATDIVKNTNSLVSNVAYAAEESNQEDEAREKLDYLGDLIDDLDDTSADLENNQLSWLDGLKSAYDITSKMLNKDAGDESEIAKSVIPRVDLLVTVAEAITADATELADSEQQAHIIIGFSVTRAILKATNIYESAESLNAASENLQKSLDKAREVPKLTDDSKRTHYTLDQLNKSIARAKNIRNKELRNKIDANELAEFDMVIKKAEDVKRDGNATVGEVNAMTEELNNKIDEVYNLIPEGERVADKDSKAELEKNIQTAKNLRDFKLKGNVEAEVIKELNKEITNANRVLNNKQSTLDQVQEANEAILEATNNAKAKLEEIPSDEEDEAGEADPVEEGEATDEDEAESVEEDEETTEADEAEPVEEDEETTGEDEVEPVEEDKESTEESELVDEDEESNSLEYIQ